MNESSRIVPGTVFASSTGRGRFILSVKAYVGPNTQIIVDYLGLNEETLTKNSLTFKGHTQAICHFFSLVSNIPTIPSSHNSIDTITYMLIPGKEPTLMDLREVQALVQRNRDTIC